MLAAFSIAEKKLKPNPELLFTDVYKEMPPHLEKQMAQMKKHVTSHKEHYPLDGYEKIK